MQVVWPCVNASSLNSLMRPRTCTIPVSVVSPVIIVLWNIYDNSMLCDTIRCVHRKKLKIYVHLQSLNWEFHKLNHQRFKIFLSLRAYFFYVERASLFLVAAEEQELFSNNPC